MGDSSSSVSVDIEIIPWGGQEHVVQTSYGPVSVFVCGDQEKPALITYPDIALNYMSCFQGLFFCPEAASLLFHNFCVYHIDAPGHELGAAAISSNIPVPTVDDLAEQVAEVLDYFGLREVICMGVTAGAYILTLFSIKYKERVAGLILVSPLCREPSWTEWLYNKLMVNLLYFYGMCGLVKETLLQRYFSEGLRSILAGESDIVRACRRVSVPFNQCASEITSLRPYPRTKWFHGHVNDSQPSCLQLLDERQSKNVMRFLEAINKRHDISEGLKKLQCRTLIFVGENSQFHEEALHMHAEMDKRFNALVEVQACGSLVVEEQPHAMLIPIEYFLMGYGFYRPPQLAEGYGSSPRSPSSPPISAELLSPQSLGLKLKPIKTRLAGEE